MQPVAYGPVGRASKIVRQRAVGLGSCQTHGTLAHDFNARQPDRTRQAARTHAS